MSTSYQTQSRDRRAHPLSVSTGSAEDPPGAQFAEVLLQSERLRATVLALFFGTLLIAGVVAAVLDNYERLRAGHGFNPRLIVLAVVAVLLSLELTLRNIASRRLRRRQPLSAPFVYGSILLEIGTSTAGSYLLVRQNIHPEGLPLELVWLLVFVTLSTLRLNFLATGLTGALAALGYLTLVYANAARSGQEIQSSHYMWVSIWIVGGGIAAGFVAREIRLHVLRVLDGARQRQVLEREVVLIAGEQERRIGRDLHDGLGSHLTGVAMLCRGLSRRLSKGEAVLQKEMDDVAQLLDTAVGQARLLARGLDPVTLDSDGLVSAVRELVATTQMVTGIPCSFSERGDLPRQDPDTEIHVYRIAQEALTNAVRHAQARRIEVSIGREGGVFALTVKDDGLGINDTRTGGGMGLRTMEYRARLIGASLTVEPDPDGGTSVRCSWSAEPGTV